MTGPAVALPDRRLWLLGRNARFNGVDFARPRPDRRDQLDVHFINRVRVRGTLSADRPPVTLTTADGTPAPRVRAVDEDADWSTDTSGRPVLRVTAEIPDVQARYLLTVHSHLLDPCFCSAVIAVRGRDGGTADCTGPAPAGQLPAGPSVPVDYLAKDFASFCQALSGFSAARYPTWPERSEADLGIVLMEALSALADELSYLQDRIAAEATLDTATQRLSLVRHARLVDYEPAPALAATAMVQFDIAPQAPGGPPLPEVIQCQANGLQTGPVDFAAQAGPSPRALDWRWNRYSDPQGLTLQLVPYLWDPARTVLRLGATSMWISGHDHGFYRGQELLIDTAGATGGDQPVREIVRVTECEEHDDVVKALPVTLIRWADGLAADHDLTRTQVAGNLLTAVQGQLTEEVFAIPGGSPAPAPLATVRADHAGSPPHCLYPLVGALAWRSVPAPDGGPAQAWPQLEVDELTAGKTAAWQWAPRLLDADGTARAFTVTQERYSPAGLASGLTFSDYDGDGATIRFGDGTFGRPPVPGTTFRARYLAGGGGAGNVAADTIVTVAPGHPAGAVVWRCTNPFAAAGGADAETDARIRDRAPQQVKAGLLSLTGPADYQAAALSYTAAGDGGAAWVRQAIAAVRWTGSWPSTVTIVDPLTDEPRDTELAGLVGLARLLRVRRLAGTDTAVAVARYRRIDLRITCAAEPGYPQADVTACVLARLDPRPGADGGTGFFGRDRWTFGQPLEASALMAAIQSCPGVAGVTGVDHREAGRPDWRPLRASLPVAASEILRIDNDRKRPGHGLLFVDAEVAR